MQSQLGEAMELRVLRYFLAVVDEGSITRAAASVRIAQPSMSRQLRQLEASLGGALFERRNGRIDLSPAGRQFAPLARDLVMRADAAVAALRDPAAVRSVNLTVVAPHTTIADVIGPFLATLGPAALRVTICEASPLAVFRVLRSGDADLGVSAGPPPGELESCPVGRFTIWAQVPASHPWGGRNTISLEDLVAQPLVLLSSEYGTRRVLDQAVASAGLKYQAVAEAMLPEVVQALAAGGLGVAVVTDDERYGLRRLPIEVGGSTLEIPLVAAWSAAHFAAPTIADWASRLAAFTLVTAQPSPGRWGPNRDG